MDPSPIIARIRGLVDAIGGLVGTCENLSGALTAFCDGQRVANREFKEFGQGVENLARAWSIVQPRLQNPTAILTPACVGKLDTILRDTSSIVQEFQRSLDEFREKYERYKKVSSHPWIKVTAQSSVKGKEHGKLIKFLNRRQVKLQRSQLDYATAVLPIVLAAIDHANARPSHPATIPRPNNEECLFTKELRARNAMEKEEQRTDSNVTAREWLQEIRVGGHSRLHTLAPLWTRPIPEELRGRYSQEEGFRRYMETSRDELIAETQEPLRRVQEESREQRERDGATIENLQNEYRQLQEDGRRRQGQDAQLIGELMHDARTHQNRYSALEEDRDRIQTQAEHQAAEAAQRYTLLRNGHEAQGRQLNVERRTNERLRHDNALQGNQLNAERRANDRLRNDNEAQGRQLNVEHQMNERLRHDNALQGNQLNAERRANDRLRNDNEAQGRQLNVERQTNEQLRHDNEDLRNQLHAQHQTIRQLRGEITRATSRLTEWENEYNAQGYRLNAQRQTIQQLRGKINRATTRIANLEDTIKAQRDALNAERQTTDRLRCQRNRDGVRIAGLGRQVQRSSENEDRLRTERNNLQRQLSGLSEEMESIQCDLRFLTDALRRQSSRPPSLPNRPSRSHIECSNRDLGFRPEVEYNSGMLDSDADSGYSS